MATESNEVTQQDAKKALFAAITRELKKLDEYESSTTSHIESLALAYRYIAGGAQPGGGCDCSK